MKEQLYKQLVFLAGQLKGKNILVSGATGLIGSRLIMLISELHTHFDETITGTGLYRSETKLSQTFPEVPKGVEMCYWDVEDSEHKTLPKYDAIIHCAGISGGSKMHLKDPRKFFLTNIGGTQRLLDYNAKENKAPFLFISTYEVYGCISQENPFSEQEYCRLDTFTLRDCYAEMKRMSEMLCCMYSSQFGFPSYAVRLTSTFGTGVTYDDPRFFAEFARCIIEGRDIVLKSTGGTVRSYLDADDAALAILYVLTCGENGNAYNLTNMQNAISIKDIAKKMIKVSGTDIELRFDISDDISKLGFRKESCTLMDANKLMALGWQPVYTLEETILKLLNSMKVKRSL